MPILIFKSERCILALFDYDLDLEDEGIVYQVIPFQGLIQCLVLHAGLFAFFLVHRYYPLIPYPVNQYFEQEQVY